MRAHFFVTALSVSKIDQNQTVVDDNTRQSNNPHNAHYTEAIAHHQVPVQGSCSTEGNNRHHQQRLRVTSERYRQQDINQQHREKAVKLQ